MHVLTNRVRRRPAAWGWFAGLLLGAAGLLAYHNSFRVPFVFDDVTAIPQNTSLRAAATWWTPPADTTVSGRPLLNASFGFNYAIGRERVFGYHAVNLALHVGAALLLYGLVRRTLAPESRAEPAGRPTPPAPPEGAALTVALLWLLHPLQTEAVTYIVQRAESLAGFLYLATLYTFARGAGAGTAGGPTVRGPAWLAASSVLCALGMAAKETMVSAPLIVLLYDRTFVSGTFRAAWQRRRAYYLGLAATWLLLAYLVASTEGRGGSAGFNADVSWWHYLLTQAAALCTYARLTLWPHPLTFDYGFSVITELGRVWGEGLVILLALGATGWALVRRPALGFLGAWFFCLLAPTSSFVPVATQTMAEHRMYLALAAPLMLLVVGLGRGLGSRGLAILLLGAAAAGVVTHQRNEDYRDALSLWTDAAAKQPGNGRTHYGVGAALAQLGRDEEAIRAFRRSIALDPASVEAHTTLGLLLQKTGRAPDAAEAWAEALRLDPTDPEANIHLGGLLAAQGRPAEALELFERARPRGSDRASLHVNYGGALLQLGRTAEAVAHLTTAVTLDARSAEAHYNLGLVRLQEGRYDAAAEHFRAVLEVAPQDQGARDNLAYCEARRTDATTARKRGAAEPPIGR